MGVDIEADNLAVRLTPEHGRLVGRRWLKSANHYCNTHLAYLKSRLDTGKFRQVADKGSRRVRDCMLKAARTLTNLFIGGSGDNGS